MKQFLSFLKKEMYHIMRDIPTMSILLAMPIVQILLFGYAISNDINEAPIAIIDNSHDATTARIVGHIDASEYFHIVGYMNQSMADDAFKKNKIKIALIFDENTEQRITKENDTQISIRVDATDPNEGSTLSSYLNMIINQSIAEMSRPNTAAGSIKNISVQTNIMYNPQMKSSYQFVPGVMGLILLLICAMMTSVGVVKEKERGTMEVLLVSPLRPVFIILAKSIPYLLISILNVVSILLLSRFLLGVPINGSVALVFFLTILYSLVALSLGLLISTIADTQTEAMMLSGVVLMLPVVLLSGMVFPIENMPDFLQWLSNIVPARWFISAVRDVMIKGVDVFSIAKEIIILFSMTVILITISIFKFKNRLE